MPESLWTAVYVLWIIGGTVFLLLRRRRPTTTLAWIIAFWGLPLISGVGYFMFGPRRLDDQSGLRQRARQAAADHIPPVTEDLQQAFIAKFDLASLARVSQTDDDPEPGPKQARAVQLFADGDSAFPAILKAIEQAEETLHLEYYIWEPDVIGTRFRDALAEKAHQGVTVRIIVDAIGGQDCRGEFWQPIVDAGGEVRKFNPPHILKPQPGKLNFRTHRKIVLIDGHIAFTGGINVSDSSRSFDNGEGEPAWRNTHLSIDGAPATGIQSIFLEDWLYSVSVDAVNRGERNAADLLPKSEKKPAIPDDIWRWFPDRDAESTTPMTDDAPWVQIVDSGPDEKSEDIHLLFFTAITSAKRRLWITTPYFVPDPPIETALASACARGVDVRIIIPADSDSKLAKAAAKTFSADASDRGAKIWLFEPHMNHSKTMIVDDELSIVGTANMDNRSFRLNFELVAAIYDHNVNAELAEMFERDQSNSRPFESDEDNAGLVNRLMANTSRLLAPLL
ncbi:phospholipase D-like domain-containing protein [Granulosicoccus antarcticus]|uniref:Major cardiolipin synthase ClsA n=1 Tax=Granulosicoccus antarcticus IMCC3135 TaxID=1192854 RepID=A0A2Z2NLD3_9GAMM|nr:phospholipase D-like domain-containing protein [Granulosicoccus antarcticus]ASJ70598.1 Major cardiolipin synthase ClsA [Granulosicoccus antarcticus IMCC3135]